MRRSDHRPATALLSAALVAGLALLSLGACSSPRTNSPHTATPTAAHATTRTTAVAIPSSVPNDPSARKDVALTSCSPVKNGWRAGGTVHNQSSRERAYRITVFFTSKSATVLGAAQTELDVPGGATRAWKASGASRPAVPTMCVLSGVG